MALLAKQVQQEDATLRQLALRAIITVGDPSAVALLEGLAHSAEAEEAAFAQENLLRLAQRFAGEGNGQAAGGSFPGGLPHRGRGGPQNGRP